MRLLFWCGRLAWSSGGWWLVVVWWLVVGGRLVVGGWWSPGGWWLVVVWWLVPSDLDRVHAACDLFVSKWECRSWRSHSPDHAVNVGLCAANVVQQSPPCLLDQHSHHLGFLMDCSIMAAANPTAFTICRCKSLKKRAALMLSYHCSWTTSWLFCFVMRLR
jgi:hypothetical protein